MQVRANEKQNRKGKFISGESLFQFKVESEMRKKYFLFSWKWKENQNQWETANHNRNYIDGYQRNEFEWGL